MPEFVYTIGHSNHSMEKFIWLLATHGITAVADVRSHPYSRFNPQFNRENLQADLKKAELTYVFLGRELGARSEDESCYVEGRVHFDRLAGTRLFQEGIARLRQGIRAYRIAVMCAEKDPLTCHRSILVGRHLATQGVTALHILEDGRIECHDDALARLLEEELGFTDGDLFRSRDEMILDAYDQRSRQIAYILPNSAEELVGRKQR